MTALSLAASTLSSQALQEAPVYPKLSSMQAVGARIEGLLAQYPKEDMLVLWDIDFTLILPKEPAFQVHNRIAYKEHLQSLFRHLDDCTASMVINCMTLFPSQLVDAQAPRVIRSLQAQGIPMIACTASMAGPLPPYTRAEAMRFEALKQEGIDFSESFPHHPDLELSGIKGFLQRSPVLYKGILFCNGLKNNPCKGEAVLGLLDALAVHPKIIIFIDDKEHYLNDMETALKGHRPETAFVGIVFTGEMEHKPEAISETEFISVWQGLKNQALGLLQAESEIAK